MMIYISLSKHIVQLHIRVRISDEVNHSEKRLVNFPFVAIMLITISNIMPTSRPNVKGVFLRGFSIFG